MSKTIKHTDSLAERLKDPLYATEYLRVCEADPDESVGELARRAVARAFRARADELDGGVVVERMEQLGKITAAIRCLSGCFPDRIYVYGCYGETWSSEEPDSNEYELVDFTELIQVADAAEAEGVERG